MKLTYEKATKTLTIKTIRIPEITTAIRSLEINQMPVDTLQMSYWVFDNLIPIGTWKGYKPTGDSGQYLIFGRVRNVQVEGRDLKEITKHLIEVK